MRRLLLLIGCAAALVPLAFASDDDPDPEPPSPDAAIKRLDAASGEAGRIGKDKVEAQRKQVVERLKRMHAGLVKQKKEKEADAMQQRVLLAESLGPGQPLETKLTPAKLLEKASAEGKYKGILHVLYVPQDRAGYGDYRDYGLSATPAYGGYNNLATGYWVYVHPRWYVWKELK